MHQDVDTIVLRLTFKPESADQFLYEDDVEAGRLVQEVDTYTLAEAIAFLNETSDHLDDALLLVDGKQVYTLADFVTQS